MRRKNEGKDRSGASVPSSNSRIFTSSFRTGAIALVFLFLGFELALFVREAAIDVIVAHRDAPDTVYVYRDMVEAPCTEAPLAPENKGNVAKRASVPGAATASQKKGNVAVEGPCAEGPVAPENKGNVATGSSAPGAGAASQGRSDAAPGAGGIVTRKDAGHTRKAASLYEQKRGRRVESFPFDPNTVSVGDLVRLGFSEKQAAAIEAYRAKGGRFHRKEDFARSYVVADSVYARLSGFIVIPLVDINAADSAAFDALPGIGGWFASKMVEYRERIGGYSSTEQLLEIYNFGVERYEGLKDLVFAGPRP